MLAEAKLRIQAELNLKEIKKAKAALEDKLGKVSDERD